MSIARTMMLHSAIHWPDVVDASLWPMAVTHATFLHNHVPDLVSGLCPIDIFTKTRWEQCKYHDLHVWDCPVYVLEKAISDGKKIPRWKPKSTRCINMGLSKKHASTVPMVLNPETGYITPQFHIVFDDWFATVATNVDALPDFNSNRWARLFGDARFQFPFDETEEVESEHARLDSETAEAVCNNEVAVSEAMDNATAVQPLPMPPPAETQFLPPTPMPSTPALETPRPPTPTFEMREPFPPLNSPPTAAVRSPIPPPKRATSIYGPTNSTMCVKAASVLSTSADPNV